MRIEIYGRCWKMVGDLSVQVQRRLVLVNILGLAALIAFTALVYLRTQETLVLLVGGLISVVSVLGTSMGKS